MAGVTMHPLSSATRNTNSVDNINKCWVLGGGSLRGVYYNCIVKDVVMTWMVQKETFKKDVSFFLAAEEE